MDNSLANLKFIFRMQNQLCSLEKCWMEGYYHAQKGNTETLNPFSEYSKESQFWLEGWWSGFYNEAALFPNHAVNLEKAEPYAKVIKLFKNNTDRALVSLGAVVGSAAIISAAIDLVA